MGQPPSSHEDGRRVSEVEFDTMKCSFLGERGTGISKMRCMLIRKQTAVPGTSADPPTLQSSEQASDRPTSKSELTEGRTDRRAIDGERKTSAELTVPESLRRNRFTGFAVPARVVSDEVQMVLSTTIQAHELVRHSLRCTSTPRHLHLVPGSGFAAIVQLEICGKQNSVHENSSSNLRCPLAPGRPR